MVPALAACAYIIWPLPGRDEIIFDVKLSEICVWGSSGKAAEV